MTAPGRPATAALETLIDRLHARGRLRVWSLVITVFGDAVVPRGGRVALGALQEIMERLRVEPGAVRTAMSRLAGDRWVTRERQGRNSFFSLDAHGRHAFDLATRRIYAGGPPRWDGTWTVAIVPPGAGEAPDLSGLGFVRVNGGVHLRPETAEAPDAAAQLGGMLVIHGASADHPEAFRALWPSDDIARAYREFIDAYTPFGAALADGPTLAPLDAMAARALLVHDWRRIVLRDPGLPATLLPEAWPGEAARALASRVYAALAAPSEGWLDGAGLPPQVDPVRFARRWRGEDAQSSR